LKKKLGKISAITTILMTILSMLSNISMIKAEPKTIIVPTNYPKIQQAIDAANPGDTILVSPGVYKENLNITKSLSLIGENNSTTIIDGGDRKIPVILINQTHDVEICRFTIKNGTYVNMKIYQCNHISIHDIISSPITNYHIEAQYSPNTHIFDCTIFDPTTKAYCGIDLDYCEGSIIENNEIYNFTGTGIMFISSNITVRDNKIYGNHKFLYERGRWGWDADGIMSDGPNNTIIQNTLFHLWDYIVLDSRADCNKVIENKFIGDPNSVLGNGIHFQKRTPTPDNNTIIGNTFTSFPGSTDNNMLYLTGENNRFYYNNFIHSGGIKGNPVSGPVNTTWDDGAGRGNYWDGYTGEDTNGDGVGDTEVPYGPDWYPLMNPYRNTIQSPTAIIDEIEPNPVKYGGNVSFTGHGLDIDGEIIEYEWTSSIDGFLSDQKSFTSSLLSVGTHSISFRVRNDDGLWSETTNETLIVAEGDFVALDINVKYDKWNVLENPFKTDDGKVDVDGAKDYVQNFHTNGEPPEDFGTIPVTANIKNTGTISATGVSIDARMTGDIIMVILDHDDITKDSPVYHHFDYEKNVFTGGSIDPGNEITEVLLLPMNYCCLVVGAIQLPDPDESTKMVPLNVVISIISVHVMLTVKGNFDDIAHEIPENLMGVCDPGDLLKEWNAELAQRVQEKQIRNFLEMYYSTVLDLKVPAINITPKIPTGIYEPPPINILPGVSRIVLSLLIPAGITLVHFTLLLFGATTSIGGSLVADGLAMIVVNNPLVGEATVRIETASPELNMTLEVVQLIPNNVKTSDYVIIADGNTFHVITVSNSTILTLNFSKVNKEINFFANGSSGTNGFCHITIPINLLSGNFTAINSDMTILSQNQTHTCIYLTYNHPNTIAITGTEAIPEFSLLMIVPLMLLLSLAVIFFRKRLNVKRK